MFEDVDDLISRRAEVLVHLAELEASGASGLDLRADREELDALTLQVAAYEPEIRQYVTARIQPHPDRFDLAVAVGTRAALKAVMSFDPAIGRLGTWVYERVQRDLLRAVHDLGLRDGL